MDRMTATGRLQDVFRAVFNDDDIEISETMTAADYEAWDSLNHIKLIMDTEKAFDIRFLNAEIARLENVGDLLTLVCEKS